MKGVGKYKSAFFKAKGKWGVAGDEVLAKSLMEFFMHSLHPGLFLGNGFHCLSRSRELASSDGLFIWTILVTMWGLLGR